MRPFYCETCGLPTYRHVSGFIFQGGKVPELSHTELQPRFDRLNHFMGYDITFIDKLRAYSDICSGYVGRNLP